ncbi:MAG TPA: globin [Pseudomonadales bacterium]|nr:globin [Pseudomonadales bacterium]
MSDVERVIESLECAAEQGGDLSPAFYAEYFRLCPDSRGLMKHIDEHVQGRMLASVYELLMLPDAGEQQRFIAFEVQTHRAYGARRYMYDHLFQALRNVIRDACGKAWTPQWEHAWNDRVEALLAEIDDYAIA